MPAGGLDRLGVAAAGIVAHADIKRLALTHDEIKRAERLLQRRLIVGPVMIKDVHIVQAHPLQRLIQAGDQIFLAAAVAVGARPHSISRLGRDNEFVSGHLLEDLAGDDFAVAGRRAVVVGKVEVGDAVVKGGKKAAAALFLHPWFS